MLLRNAILLPGIAALAACAVAESNPPSLAHRNIEGTLDQPIRAIAPVASADDPALASRIAGLVDQAETGQRAFAELLPRARSAVERGSRAAPESDAWIDAQLAVSALDSARAPTTTALGELDTIFASQISAGEPAEIERLTAARDRVTTLYREQSRTYEALASSLRQG